MICIYNIFHKKKKDNNIYREIYHFNKINYTHSYIHAQPFIYI